MNCVIQTSAHDQEVYCCIWTLVDVNAVVEIQLECFLTLYLNRPVAFSAAANPRTLVAAMRAQGGVTDCSDDHT